MTGSLTRVKAENRTAQRKLGGAHQLVSPTPGPCQTVISSCVSDDLPHPKLPSEINSPPLQTRQTP